LTLGKILHNQYIFNMKNIIALVLILSTGFNCFSQSFSSLVVYLTDEETGSPLPNGLVIIKEAGWASKLTGNDGKAYFDKSMPIGEIRYIVNLEGYQGREGAFNITTEEKSNTLNIKLAKFQYERLLITGEVNDENNKDLIGATIELKYADIIKTTKTDQSGNYSLELTLNQTKYSDNILKFEVKYKEVCKQSEVVDLPRRNVVYKDFKLNCSRATDKEENRFSGEKNQPILDKECERKNTGDFCVENKLKIQISVNVDDQFFMFINAGETQCLYNLKQGNYGCLIKKAGTYNVISKGEILIKKCVSNKYVVK